MMCVAKHDGHYCLGFVALMRERFQILFGGERNVDIQDRNFVQFPMPKFNNVLPWMKNVIIVEIPPLSINEPVKKT
jgi:hypothetical protein